MEKELESRRRWIIVDIGLMVLNALCVVLWAVKKDKTFYESFVAGINATIVLFFAFCNLPGDIKVYKITKDLIKLNKDDKS